MLHHCSISSTAFRCRTANPTGMNCASSSTSCLWTSCSLVSGVIWEEDRCHLRQACQHACRLTDDLVTSINIQDITPIEKLIPRRAPCHQEPWHQQTVRRSAFLSRLKHLTALHITHWPNEQSLLTLLTRFRGSAKGGLKVLELTGHPVSLSTTLAVRLVCPHLQQLGVNFSTDTEWRRRPDRAALEGDVLLPLLDLLSLTMVRVMAPCANHQAPLDMCDCCLRVLKPDHQRL